MQNCDFDDDGPPPIIKPRSSNPEGPCKSIRIGRLLLTDRGLMGCSADDTHGVDPRPVGTVFLDDLVRVGDIGAGAQGVVTKYKHATTKERYAVKFVQIPTGTNTHDLLKKVPEVRNVVKQHHPNTVPLYNAYLRNNQLILVMEYMGGGNVAKLVQQGTPVPEKIAAYVVSQVANALAHIHRKHKSSDDAKETSQVHRDIKPANILLSRSGAVKLADFGVAGNAGTQGLSSFVGTITYMSPERVVGHYHHTSSDVWSLGVVAAELLLGRNPFSASEVLSEALGKIAECKRIDLTGVAGISTAAQAFLDRCVVQDPAARWSAAQLLEHEWIASHVKDPEPGRLDLCQVLADLQRREPV